MEFIDRCRKLFTTPKTEWEAIAADATPTAKLVTGYVLPLAAYAAVAGFIGKVVVGTPLAHGGVFRVSFGVGLASALLQVVVAVLSVYILAFIIDALAPHFEATRSFDQAAKVAAYAHTPIWVLSIFGIIPWIGGVLMLAAAALAIYQLYLGLPRVMRASAEKSPSYTGVVVILGFAAAMILSVVVASPFR